MDFRTISAAQRATLRAQAGSVTEIGIARSSAVSHIQVVQAVQAPEGTSAGPPEGWNVYPHDDHGQVYKNPLTGETMWPSFPGAPTLPRAPEGWEVHPHAEHGQYYHNPVTKQTLWTRPGGEAVAPDAAAVAAEDAFEATEVVEAKEEGGEVGAAALASAAASAAAPQQQHDENWFYTDSDDVQHGPFTLVQLKEWLEDGQFEASKLICNGREGHQVELGSAVEVEDTPEEETRIGEDGFPYKEAAFLAHYGGTDEWDAAEAVAPDAAAVAAEDAFEATEVVEAKEEGGEVGAAAFLAHHGGTDEWDAAGDHDVFMEL